MKLDRAAEQFRARVWHGSVNKVQQALGTSIELQWCGEWQDLLCCALLTPLIVDAFEATQERAWRVVNGLPAESTYGVLSSFVAPRPCP